MTEAYLIETLLPQKYAKISGAIILPEKTWNPDGNTVTGVQKKRLLCFETLDSDKLLPVKVEYYLIDGEARFHIKEPSSQLAADTKTIEQQLIQWFLNKVTGCIGVIKTKEKHLSDDFQWIQCTAIIATSPDECTLKEYHITREGTNTPVERLIV